MPHYHYNILHLFQRLARSLKTSEGTQGSGIETAGVSGTPHYPAVTVSGRRGVEGTMRPPQPLRAYACRTVGGDGTCGPHPLITIIKQVRFV